MISLRSSVIGPNLFHLQDISYSQLLVPSSAHTSKGPSSTTKDGTHLAVPETAPAPPGGNVDYPALIYCAGFFFVFVSSEIIFAFFATVCRTQETIFETF